jgi:NADH-quinone oxidoreductase subunit A
MSDAVASSLGIVAYLALFASVGLVFVFANLLLGSFVRPSDPNDEKMEIYECGEPSIGSGFVQFDLRFYVVALLFIIFDVEVALFFPWAVIFGKANNLADPDLPVVIQQADGLALTTHARSLVQEMGVRDPALPTRVPASMRDRVESRFGAASASAPIANKEVATMVIRQSAKDFAWLTVLDIAVFFGVLMVGFAYVWKRGDLNWVRAIRRQRYSRRVDDEEAAPSEQFISA